MKICTLAGEVGLRGAGGSGAEIVEEGRTGVASPEMLESGQKNGAPGAS